MVSKLAPQRYYDTIYDNRISLLFSLFCGIKIPKKNDLHRILSNDLFTKQNWTKYWNSHSKHCTLAVFVHPRQRLCHHFDHCLLLTLFLDISASRMKELGVHCLPPPPLLLPAWHITCAQTRFLQCAQNRAGSRTHEKHIKSYFGGNCGGWEFGKYLLWSIFNILKVSETGCLFYDCS